MAESTADKLKALDKQRAEILGAFVKERQGLIKQKKEEVAKLEEELRALLSPKSAAKGRKAGTTTKAPAKAKTGPKAGKLPAEFTAKELAGIIEGLKEGIKEAGELKRFVGKGRRIPLINKALEAYKALGPKERTAEALEAAMKSLKAKKPE
ncbi:MAG: hypothetical protein M0Z80_13605 [Treponema sp.]|nr:hypothetical protein [Treponema sp.]